jgi:hypothetical protein
MNYTIRLKDEVGLSFRIRFVHIPGHFSGSVWSRVKTYFTLQSVSLNPGVAYVQNEQGQNAIILGIGITSSNYNSIIYR